MIDITERLRKLSIAVSEQNWQEFSMRVPAEPDRDADIVIMQAAMLIESRDAEIAYLQSRIDELMLEYCPDEITKEQLDNYAAHQRPVDESELPEAIRARGDSK